MRLALLALLQQPLIAFSFCPFAIESLNGVLIKAPHPLRQHLRGIHTSLSIAFFAADAIHSNSLDTHVHAYASCFQIFMFVRAQR